ncbi:MAG TPA: hypothetical protein VJ550_05735 [Geomonas sp.]|nr:hypothetical protein [Geomonas sp.]
MLDQSAKMRWFAFAVALGGVLAGCLGPLTYRPPEKKAPVVASVASKGAHLPPAPDPKLNNATAAGIDTTGLGIRDDIDIWIYTNYSTAKKRAAMIQMAKALQAVVVNPPKSSDEAKKMQQAYDDAILKLKEIPGINPGETSAMDRSLYEEMFNTPDRLKAYLQYNLLLGGKEK